MPGGVAVGTEQDALSQFFLNACPTARVCAREVELLFIGIRVVDMQRSKATVVSTVDAFATEEGDDPHLQSEPPVINHA